VRPIMTVSWSAVGPPGPAVRRDASTDNGFSPTPSVAEYLSSAASRLAVVNAPIGILKSRKVAGCSKSRLKDV